MSKSRPFLEVFALALKENFRFPMLEVFAFLYTFGTFFLSGTMALNYGQTNEIYAHSMANSLAGLPLFILEVLIWRNLAYGLGGDIEKGVMQTLLLYPLKRKSVLTAKLLSALGINLVLFLGIQTFALFVLAPFIVQSYLGTILLTYAAILSLPLLIAGIVLMSALVLKRGGLALITGIVLYFALGIVGSMIAFLSFSGSDIPLRVYALIAPNLALDRYYLGLRGASISWVPSFFEALAYIGASYVLVAVVFILGYIYFERRLET